jgi:heme/copper-type cytochrome/quinol oxidase subunit 2
MKRYLSFIFISISSSFLILLTFCQPVFATTFAYIPSRAEKIGDWISLSLGLLSIIIFIFILVNLVILFANRKNKAKRKKISKRILITIIILAINLGLFYMVFVYFIDFLKLFLDPNNPIFESDYYMKSCYGPLCPNYFK